MQICSQGIRNTCLSDESSTDQTADRAGTGTWLGAELEVARMWGNSGWFTCWEGVMLMCCLFQANNEAIGLAVDPAQLSLAQHIQGQTLGKFPTVKVNFPYFIKNNRA